MSLAYTPAWVILEDIARQKKEAILNAELHKQFVEEYGDEPLPAHKLNHRSFNQNRTYDSGCMGCTGQAAYNALRQKYGLLPVQLTDKERKVVAREDRRLNADALMRG